jgi:hypothetical protein
MIRQRVEGVLCYAMLCSKLTMYCSQVVPRLVLQQGKMIVKGGQSVDWKRERGKVPTTQHSSWMTAAMAMAECPKGEGGFTVKTSQRMVRVWLQ